MLHTVLMCVTMIPPVVSIGISHENEYEVFIMNMTQLVQRCLWPTYLSTMMNWPIRFQKSFVSAVLSCLISANRRRWPSNTTTSKKTIGEKKFRLKLPILNTDIHHHTPALAFLCSCRRCPSILCIFVSGTPNHATAIVTQSYRSPVWTPICRPRCVLKPPRGLFIRSTTSHSMLY